MTFYLLLKLNVLARQKGKKRGIMLIQAYLKAKDMLRRVVE